MYCDFHTHLDMYDDINPIVREINDNAILSIASSIDVPSYEASLHIAKESSLIIPTFGIHPSKAHTYESQLDDLGGFIYQSPLIGEIGLDYLWVDPLNKNVQIKVFKYIAQKAAELDKFIVVHTKGAEEDILNILDDIGSDKVIIHWYSGPFDIYKKYISRGWYFTFGVELEYSPHIRSLARITPTDRLLAETDNPIGFEWLAGRTGMPSDIIVVYNTLADTLGLSLSQLKTLLGNNANCVLEGF